MAAKKKAELSPVKKAIAKAHAVAGKGENPPKKKK